MKLCVQLCAALWLAAAPLNSVDGAPPVIRFVDSGQQLGENGNSFDVALGDLDADGDLDAVVANYGGATRLSQIWINQGGAQGGSRGTFVQSSQRPGTGFSRSVGLADLDGDNDLDAFFVEGSLQAASATYQIWFNENGQFQKSDQVMTGNGYSVALGQLDGKAGVDAFLAATAALAVPNEVWFGDGTGQFSESGQRLGEGQGTDVALGDLDGDGDLDAFSTHFESDKVWINQGGAQAGAPGDFLDGQLGGSPAIGQGVALGDMDGDGDLDAFVTGSGAGRADLWVNQGGRQGGTAGKFSRLPQDLTILDGRRLALGDLDRDGDLDAFVPTGFGNRVYANDDGLGKFVDTGLILDVDSTTAVALGDLDGDGDLDAFAANAGRPNKIWVNTSPPPAATVPEYIITTIAGNGTEGSAGDGGPAVDAQLHSPADVAIDDDGNIFIADAGAHRVRKVTSAGVISTVAGTGTAGFGGDGGAATTATLNGPNSVALDLAGNLYIVDAGNHRVRRVNSDGTISTFAGSGSGGFSGDGQAATDAELSRPQAIEVDAAGNVYIADDGNGRIRKVDNSGIITTVAGMGSEGSPEENIPASRARLSNTLSLAADDAGNLYLGGFATIRKVDRHGIITTFAGTGNYSFGGDGGPATGASFTWVSGLATDPDGNVFLADEVNYCIRRVDTNGIIGRVAGYHRQSFGSFGGDGGPAIESGLSAPQGLAMDRNGNVFIADQRNRRVPRLTPTGATLPLLPNLAATPAPGSHADFGQGSIGQLFQEARTVHIANTGPADLRIESIEFSGGTAGFTWDRVVRRGSTEVAVPLVVPSAHDGNLTVEIKLRGGLDVGEDEPPQPIETTLRIVSNDPDMPVAAYSFGGVVVSSPPLEEFEESAFAGIFVRSAASSRKNSLAGTMEIAAGVQTATMFPDTNSSMRVSTGIPAFLGGGTVVISNFSGSATISLVPIASDSERAVIRVEGGTFTAPSFRLPSGLETGPNTLTFGPSNQSGGLLILTNGSYTAFASATIRNTLFPDGIPVRGTYSGHYDPATGRASVQSRSTDSYYPSNQLRMNRALSQLILNWLPGGILEATTNVLGPWISLTNAVSPLSMETTRQPKEFFRLRSPTP